MDATLSPDIFISHSTKDDPEVDRIAEALRTAGLSVWVDHQNGIPIGTPSFDQMIQDNLNKCRRGLLILTGDSARSLECNGEWRHLLTHKRLYVARLKDFPQTEFPSRLAIIQYANLLRDYGQGLDALIQALQQDTALAASHPGTALALRTSGQFPNWQLSLPIIGRDEALAKTSQLLTQARAVVLTGPGGVGKTRLAAELSSRAANPDGVIWHTLAAATTPAQAEADLDKLTALLRGHFSDLAPTDDPDTVWNTLGASQALLILDNAEDCQHPQPFVARVNQLNQRSSGLGVLITSRHVWPRLKAATPYPLLMPAAPDAERMFYNMADLKLEPSLPRPTAAEVATLAEAGRYHPRLLEFAATWLQAYPVRKVEQWLRTLRGEKPEEVLADVLGHTLDLVARQPHGPLALAALSRLLVCQGGFTPEAAEALLADLPDATDTLDILVAWNLIRWNGRRYDTDLLTREATESDPAAYPLHYNYYATLARQHNEKQDYVGLVPEAANLEVAFEWTMQDDEIERAYWLANVAKEMLHNRGRFTQELGWLQRVESALPTEANVRLKGAVFNSLGISYIAQPLGEREANLRRAVSAFEQALVYYIEAGAPLDYAGAQNNLGIAYRDLSEVSEREANLHRAIQAYEQALVYSTEEANPLAYAGAQNNLGTAYRDLAQVSNREANLHRAIQAHKRALVYYTETIAPLDYAGVQNNLGNAYSNLSQVTEREANLRRAISAFEKALVYYTEAAAPLDYATTQTSLGITYRNLSQVSEREANLHRAIKAFKHALVHRTEATAPLDYTTTQTSLGNAYRDLSQVSEREANLRQAIQIYEQALVHRIEVAAPLSYATTQNSLGAAYSDLSEVSDREANLRRAISAFEQALIYRTEAAAPLGYATTQSNLGAAYRGLSEVSDREANLRRAIQAYEQALVQCTEATAPLIYAAAQSNLGNAYLSLSEVSDREDNLRRAISAFEQALVYHAEVAAPLVYAMTQNNLGNAYRDLSQVSEREVNLRRAIQAYEQALVHYTETAAPLDFARVQNCLGNACSDLSQVSEREANLRRAIQAYEQALVHRTEAATPLAYAMTQNSLGKACQQMIFVTDPQTHVRKAAGAYEAVQRVAMAQQATLPYAEAIMNLGILLEITNRLPSAIIFWREAEQYYRQAGDVVNADRMLNWIQEAQQKLADAQPTEPQ